MCFLWFVHCTLVIMLRMETSEIRIFETNTVRLSLYLKKVALMSQKRFAYQNPILHYWTKYLKIFFSCNIWVSFQDQVCHLSSFDEMFCHCLSYHPVLDPRVSEQRNLAGNKILSAVNQAPHPPPCCISFCVWGNRCT